MTEEKSDIFGISADEWAAAFRPGMPEFSASRFLFSRENNNQVRIAFGNDGPYLNPEKRNPVYTHAITVTPEIAVELARLLLKQYAQPYSAINKSSKEL